jgi:hypothetical protein
MRVTIRWAGGTGRADWSRLFKSVLEAEFGGPDAFGAIDVLVAEYQNGCRVEEATLNPLTDAEGAGSIDVRARATAALKNAGQRMYDEHGEPA